VLDQDVNRIPLGIRIVLGCQHNHQEIIASSNRLQDFRAIREELVCNAWDDKTYRSRPVAFQNTRGLIWQVAKRFDGLLHAG